MPLLIDTTNLYRCVRRKFGPEARILYEEFIPAIEKMFGPQQIKIAYVAKPSDKAIAFADFLRHLSFQTRVKEPREFEQGGEKRQHTDWAVEMTIDALQTSNKDEPTILCSSDYRLAALIDALQNRTGLVAVWAVGIPRSFNCVQREIEEDFVDDADLITT